MKEKQGEKVGANSGGLSRRGFLTTMGAGTIVMGTVAGASAAPPFTREAEPETGSMTELSLRINGEVHNLLVEPRWTLLYVLREKLGLTGTKVGCERGECGACTVLIDDIPRYACLTLALEAEGSRITTLEGLLEGENLGPVQQAFQEKDGFQCGYCTPGQIMAAEGLLRMNPAPSAEEIRKGMSGNLCRCGTYHNIFESVQQGAELKRKGRGAA